MLVLTRRIGERVMIGRDVVIEVLAIEGNQVRIAFDAPREVEIQREEVYRRIEREEGRQG